MPIPADVQAKIGRHAHVCGSDECGLGSWAGPLSVCAVVVPAGWSLHGVTDSKKLSRAARERVYPELIKQVTYCLIHVGPSEFDAMGCGVAFLDAHARAITGALALHHAKGHPEKPLLIIDGVRPVLDALPLPKADSLIPAVSAASIIAKVNHDWVMDELDRQYPQYGFAKSSGYGTPHHRMALKQFGVSEAHRRSYSPMCDMGSSHDVLTMLSDLE